MLSKEHKEIALEIYQLLCDKGVTVGTAESCTAGMISATLTSVPGSSSYFIGGIASYANSVKTHMLGVPPQLLEEKTAVCEEVAIAMVRGALSSLHCDYAVSVTGYAGPTADDGQSVGTIWIAAGRKAHIDTIQLTEDHGREENVRNATLVAMKLLLNVLRRDLIGRSK